MKKLEKKQLGNSDMPISSVGFGAWAIAWTLGHRAVTGAIVGARSAQQVDGVMNAGSLRLTNQERAEIEAPSEVPA